MLLPGCPPQKDAGCLPGLPLHSCCTACSCNAQRLAFVHVPEQMWIKVCCTLAPKLTSCGCWHRLWGACTASALLLISKQGSLLFAHKRRVDDSLNDGQQAATHFSGGAWWSAPSTSSQRQLGSPALQRTTLLMHIEPT